MHTFTIELHFIDGHVDSKSVLGYESLANLEAKRIAAVFARAAARGDIDDNDIPWIAVFDENGEETRH